VIFSAAKIQNPVCAAAEQTYKSATQQKLHYIATAWYI